MSYQECSEWRQSDIKADICRWFLLYGPEVMTSLWNQAIQDMRTVVREYETPKTMTLENTLETPELIYQKQSDEKPKKPRKPRQKKKI
jgi:hypothetical protein